MRLPARGFAAVPLVLLAAATGCVSSETNSAASIRGDDTSTLSTVGRVTWVLFPTDLDRLGRAIFPTEPDAAGADAPPAAAAAAGAPARRVTGTLAFDGEFGRTSGSDRTVVRSGDFVAVDDARIDGPADLKVTTRLSEWSLSARGGLRVRDRFGLEGIIGAIGYRMSGSLRDGVHDTVFSTQTTGLLLGVEANARVIDQCALYGRWSGSLGRNAQLTLGEVGLRSRINDTFGLFAGWRLWKYREPHRSKSSLTFVESGPLVGLFLMF